MSFMPVQPAQPNISEPELITPPPPSFHPHSHRRLITADIYLDFEAREAESGREVSHEAIHLADVTWCGGPAGSRFSQSTATTATTAAATVPGSPPQGFGYAWDDSHSNSHFAVIPSRPPLRPTPSFRGDETFSYYGTVSPELDYKSMLVALEEVTDKSGPRSSRWGSPVCFITLCALNFLCGFDRSCLITALPSISNVTSTQVFWVVISYMASASLIQPLSMRLVSSIGIKPVAVTSLSIWAAASLASALVESYAALIASRTVSGIGAGALASLILSAVRQLKGSQTTVFHERLLSISFWLGLAIGPIVGGAFVQLGLWQYVFFITFTMCLAGLMVLSLFLRLPSLSGWTTALRQIEYLHWILLVTGFVPLVWSITSGGTAYPWLSWHILLPLFAGLFCVVSWCVCASMTSNPILPVSILRQPAALAAALGTIVHGMIVTAIIYLIPLLCATMKAGAVAMGITLLPLTLALVFGLLCGWHSSPILQQGSELSAWALLTLCTGSMVLFDAENVGILSIVLGVFSGLGLGILATVLSTSFQASATTDDETIHAAPMQTFLATLGNALGVTLGSCVFLNSFSLDASTTDPLKLLHDFVQSSTINNATAIELGHTFFTAMRPVWITLCVLSGVAFAVSITCCLIQTLVRVRLPPFEDAHGQTLE